MNQAINSYMPSSKWHVLAATWLGEMFDGMDASIFILVMFPALSDLLKTTSHSEVGIYGSIVLAIFMMGWAIGAIVFGIVADHIGRAKALVITILIYAIATGLCAISRSWIELTVYRFVVGCGIGGEISIGGTLLAEIWKGKSRLYATGFMVSSYPFGYLIAAIINSLSGSWGWRCLYLVGIIPAILTLYIRAKISDPVEFREMKNHEKTLRLKKKSELTVEESQLLAPRLSQVFRGDNKWKITLATALASTAIIGLWAVLAWIPPWINQLTGTQAIQERSLAAVVMNIGSIISSCLAGFFVIKFGYRKSFMLSYAGSLACCIGMFLSTKSFGPWLLIWTFAVGFFALLPFALLFIFVPTLFPTAIRATAFGFSVQIGRIVAAIATLLSGQLIAAFGGSYAYAGACVACLYIIGITASFKLPITKDQESNSCEI